MGTLRRARRTGMADALFTPVQQRVLALLFGQPERRYQSAELIRLAKGGTGAVHRQLARLAPAGAATRAHTGNQKHHQAPRAPPPSPAPPPAGAALARPINPTVMTPREWRAKLAKPDSFVRRVASGPRLLVIGSDAGLD